MGSNLGDRAQTLRRALSLMEAHGLTVRAASHLYETEPEGGDEEPMYLNAVAWVETDLDARNLLAKLQEIEVELGRPRGHEAGPRTCDLDLLALDREIVDRPALELPHPRMHERSFVLVPLCELDPRWVHPVSGETSATLLGALPVRPGTVRLHGKLWPKPCPSSINTGSAPPSERHRILARSL